MYRPAATQTIEIRLDPNTDPHSGIADPNCNPTKSNRLVFRPRPQLQKNCRNPFITCWDTLQNVSLCPYLLLVKESWKMIQDPRKNLDLLWYLRITRTCRVLIHMPSLVMIRPVVFELSCLTHTYTHTHPYRAANCPKNDAWVHTDVAQDHDMTQS